MNEDRFEKGYTEGYADAKFHFISEFVKKIESAINRMPNGKIEYIGHSQIEDILKEYRAK